MKKILAAFLFILFSLSSSYADNYKKITVEELENYLKVNFFGEDGDFGPDGPTLSEEYLKKKKIKDKAKEKEINLIEKNKILENERDFKKWKKKNYSKRVKNRNLAACLYNNKGVENCGPTLIRAVLTYSEKSKKRRPGDIFYVFDYIQKWSSPWLSRKLFIEQFRIDIDDKIKSKPGMKCIETYNHVTKKYNKDKLRCRSYNKSFYKKFLKFKENPSNEKILGHKRIDILKRYRIVNDIEDRLGTDEYALLGDMLNSVVVDVKKNIISPEVKLRRKLLKKYSLLLGNIEKKLNSDNYKSLDKDLKKLDNNYKNFENLNKTQNDIAIKFDEGILVISDVNHLIKDSLININNNENKILALSSIKFMKFLLESISNDIPEDYYAETTTLNSNLFHFTEIDKIELFVNNMIEKNKKTRLDELNKNINNIKKYSKQINPNVIISKLENLGIKNFLKRSFTQDTAANIARETILDNLDNDVVKDAKKILQRFEKENLSNLTKEVSKVASEISSDPATKSTVSNSAVDRKYGGQSLKKLIAAGIIKR